MSGSDGQSDESVGDVGGGMDAGAHTGELPEQLTSAAAADVLGISSPTLAKWVSERRIDASKKGTHARFKREDVLELRRRNAEVRCSRDFGQWPQ
ncbi:MAG TPA: helix-turn-helix domain-containing protein [Candidatus Brevibacterium intestinigallinarum]|nr:helix-turn-helix domain-containing protein [Candidatus Brevibacterium intestinigallinarum]